MKQKVTRSEAIEMLVGKKMEEADGIISSVTELLADIFEYGHVGFKKYTNKELEDEWNHCVIHLSGESEIKIKK